MRRAMILELLALNNVVDCGFMYTLTTCQAMLRANPDVAARTEGRDSEPAPRPRRRSGRAYHGSALQVRPPAHNMKCCGGYIATGVEAGSAQPQIDAEYVTVAVRCCSSRDSPA